MGGVDSRLVVCAHTQSFGLYVHRYVQPLQVHRYVHLPMYVHVPASKQPIPMHVPRYVPNMVPRSVLELRAHTKYSSNLEAF